MKHADKDDITVARNSVSYEAQETACKVLGLKAKILTVFDKIQRRYKRQKKRAAKSKDLYSSQTAFNTTTAPTEYPLSHGAFSDSEDVYSLKSPLN